MALDGNTREIVGVYIGARSGSRGLMVTVHRLEIADSLLNPTRDEHIVHLEGPTQELVGPLDLVNKRRV